MSRKPLAEGGRNDLHEVGAGKMAGRIWPFLLKLILAAAYVKILRFSIGGLSPETGAMAAIVANLCIILMARFYNRASFGLRHVNAFLAAACLSSLVVMPREARAYLIDGWGIWLLAVPVLLHLLWGGVRAIATFRGDSADPRGRLQNALGQLLPEALARVAAAELTIISNAFLWMSPPDVPTGVQSFSYHRLVAPILWAFFCLAVVEALGVHLLVGLWKPSLGWVIFIISDISLLYLLGLICSLRRMPVTIDDQDVRIRAGILYDFRVPLASIINASIAFPSSDVKRPGTIKTSLMTFPNIMLEVFPPIPSPKPLGLGEPVHHVAMALDDKVAFINALRSNAVQSATL